jgi:hypothetical protein
MAMGINPQDETSYTIQYQDAFLKNVENESCTRQRRMSVNKPDNVQPSNFFHSAQASVFVQASFDPYE